MARRVARPRQCYPHFEIESGRYAAIKGEATWGSGAGTHTGELDYDAKPSADKMKFGDGTDELDCQVTMQFVGKHLVVGDNLHCGGANVSFSGVYQRRRKR